MLYDFRDFCRSNRGKLLIFAAVNLLAIALGIRGGFAISDVNAYLCSHSCNTFSFLAGRKSIFGYFFMELLTDIILLIMLALTSLHFVLSYLSFVILFFRTYLFALYMTLYLILLKLSVLPFVLLCLLPCFLIALTIFCVVAALAFDRARDAWRYGAGCTNTFAQFLRGMILPGSMLVILRILCTILAYFLTLGIIL